MTYLDIFKQLNAIPRPSHHEEQVADFLCHFAEEHNLTYRRDANNCVVIEKPASPGYENHEPVVILNHMDMVCVAEPEKPFNPQTSAIEAVTYEENGERWMRANGTSLGADNGIGLSMALAILADDTLHHPTLEVLTTTNEEDGMSGAAGLESDFIKGRRIINLDSEAYDEITVASAGAYMQKAKLPYHRISMPKDYVAYDVSVFGGKGGHSGVDINLGRGNAIKILANLLLVAIRQLNIKLYIINFRGGQAAAAIPGEAEAKVVVPIEEKENFEMLVKQCDEALMAQYSETDTDLEVTCDETVWNGTIINEEGTHLLLASLNAIPVGPVAMRDGSAPGSTLGSSSNVLTSNNIGIVKQSTNAFTVSIHTRSFDNNALHDMATNISQIFSLTGAEVECQMDLSSWQEEEDNEFITLALDSFQNTLGFKPKKVSMHFALEAGYLVEKFPGVHIVSIGPRILYPHSTHECVNLNTAENIWKVTLSLLKSV
ncbi:MAG: beta-Ala-His dipeptidase [Prevotella sp.]|nr:beta-Ala-His dipeptidase [Candidatus Prevotella equi]